MRKATVLIVATILALFLVSCEALRASGGRTRSSLSGNSGWLEKSHKKANGATTLNLSDNVVGLEDAVASGDVLEVDLTLAVGMGSVKIELLGEDEQVTLALEARDGETVTGHGQIVAGNFGNVPYRLTATEAENVDYYMEYTIH